MRLSSSSEETRGVGNRGSMACTAATMAVAMSVRAERTSSTRFVSCACASGT
jgi:hypothetical protein